MRVAPCRSGPFCFMWGGDSRHAGECTTGWQTGVSGMRRAACRHRDAYAEPHYRQGSKRKESGVIPDSSVNVLVMSNRLAMRFAPYYADYLSVVNL